MAKSKKKVLMPSGIRNKLLAAVAMLMVSSIMVVSSTYAWFTLSTAPEVKNITTTVAGNGSLEIALMPASGRLSEIGNGLASESAGGTVAVTTANTTWGNVINLSDGFYGLGSVTLLPALFDATTLNKPLKTPVYGADGRVASLETNTSLKTWDEAGAKFVTKAEPYGVRAVGEGEDNSFTSYGYVVDLAVRLNTAKDSTTSGKLLLQTEGTQRISGSANQETMGGGSYMQFDTVQTGIDLKTLLDSIRITFVSDYGKVLGANEEPEVLATARLDTTGITAGPTTATSTEKLYLYLYTETTNGDVTTAVKSEDNTLLEVLEKNVPAQISALVWLDGNNLKNSSVAATALQSMNGVLNLQFATDVTLTPAQNTTLMSP